MFINLIETNMAKKDCYLMRQYKTMKWVREGDVTALACLVIQRCF